MILLTGSGHSGTTFMTNLFKELGFQLLPELMNEGNIRKGLEGKATEISLKLCSLRGFRYINGKRAPLWSWKRLMNSSVYYYRLLRQRDDFPLIRQPWSQKSLNMVPPPELANEMRELKADVIKTPFALRILEHWLNVRHDIDLVIFCIRDLKIVAKRWKRSAGHKESESIQKLYESYGMAFCAMHSIDREVPYVVISFPQSAKDVEYLYGKLEKPLQNLGRTFNFLEFSQAYHRIVKPEWIHN